MKIVIYKGYIIKDKLKNMQYVYNNLDKSWNKNILKEELNNEMMYLTELKIKYFLIEIYIDNKKIEFDDIYISVNNVNKYWIELKKKIIKQKTIIKEKSIYNSKEEYLKRINQTNILFNYLLLKDLNDKVEKVKKIFNDKYPVEMEYINKNSKLKDRLYYIIINGLLQSHPRKKTNITKKQINTSIKYILNDINKLIKNTSYSNQYNDIFKDTYNLTSDKQYFLKLEEVIEIIEKKDKDLLFSKTFNYLYINNYLKNIVNKPFFKNDIVVQYKSYLDKEKIQEVILEGLYKTIDKVIIKYNSNKINFEYIEGFKQYIIKHTKIESLNYINKIFKDINEMDKYVKNKNNKYINNKDILNTESIENALIKKEQIKELKKIINRYKSNLSPMDCKIVDYILEINHSRKFKNIIYKETYKDIAEQYNVNTKKVYRHMVKIKEDLKKLWENEIKFIFE